MKAISQRIERLFDRYVGKVPTPEEMLIEARFRESTDEELAELNRWLNARVAGTASQAETDSAEAIWQAIGARLEKR